MFFILKTTKKKITATTLVANNTFTRSQYTHTLNNEECSNLYFS